MHATAAARSRRRLRIAFVLTTGVMLAELAGGLWSGSLVLLADAGHMLTDAGALGLALFAIWFAARPSPPHRTYGHYRAEILAAVANAVLLGLVCFFIIREAAQRLRHPTPYDAVPVLILGCVGLAVNLVGARLLHADSRRSLNVRGAYLEMLADLFGSLGVVVAALLQMRLGWMRADPVLSLAIALIILPRIWVLLREATDVLMEAAPRHMDITDVRRAILRQEGVTDVHDLHVWTITSGRICLSAHVVTGPGTDRDQVIAGINRQLREAFGLDHATLQVEGQREPVVSGQSAAESCDPCAPAEQAAAAKTSAAGADAAGPAQPQDTSLRGRA